MMSNMQLTALKRADIRDLILSAVGQLLIMQGLAVYWCI